MKFKMFICSYRKCIFCKVRVEKIDAFMTDAVSKNLNVEEEFAKKLESSHMPLHLLCKSHTCKKFDETNIKSLSQVENIIG